MLGRAIVQLLSEETHRLINRSETRGWENSKSTIREYLLSKNISNHDLIIYTLGNTDPSADIMLLNGVNFVLPRNLFMVAADMGVRMLTFGTVLESLPPTNNYLASKKNFYEFLKNQSFYENFDHLQINTLYGSYRPKPYMFLGRILHAITHNSKFRMSEGKQLREYWHVNDVASAIMNQIITQRPNQFNSITSGSPVSLQKLAEYIFERFNRSSLLAIGELSSTDFEIFDSQFFIRNENLLFKEFMRDPLNGIIECLRAYIDLDQQ